MVGQYDVIFNRHYKKLHNVKFKMNLPGVMKEGNVNDQVDKCPHQACIVPGLNSSGAAVSIPYQKQSIIQSRTMSVCSSVRPLRSQ